MMLCLFMHYKAVIVLWLELLYIQANPPEIRDHTYLRCDQVRFHHILFKLIDS